MEISPDKFIPRNKRAVKVKEQLDDRFLSRSKRTALKLDGLEKVSIHSHMCVRNTHRTLHTHIPHMCTHTHVLRLTPTARGGTWWARPSGARAGRGQ